MQLHDKNTLFKILSEFLPRVSDGDDVHFSPASLIKACKRIKR